MPISSLPLTSVGSDFASSPLAGPASSHAKFNTPRDSIATSISTPIPTPIIEAWPQRANELANWADQYLVNRRDAWVVPVNDKPITPDAKLRCAAGTLTLSDLATHFQSHSPKQRIALPPLSLEHTCRWFAILVHRHNDTAGQPDPTGPGDNLHAALWWYERLAKRGFDPILEETGPDGRYRLLVLFDFPVDARRAIDFADNLISDFGHRDLVHRPVLLPDHPDIQTATPIIDTDRVLWLPGIKPVIDPASQHDADTNHKPETMIHTSRIWDPQQETWLDGFAAIDALLGTRRSPEALLKQRPQTTIADANHNANAHTDAHDQHSEEPIDDNTIPDLMPETSDESFVAPTPNTSASSHPTPAPPPDLHPIIHTIAQRTGLRENEILPRTLDWLAQQDDVIQALVLGQIPEKIRPDLIQLLATHHTPPTFPHIPPA